MLFFCTADAVRMNESTSNTVNKVCEDKIKIWLRQARDRDGGRKRRFLAAAARQTGSTDKRSLLDIPTDHDDDDDSDVESD